MQWRGCAKQHSCSRAPPAPSKRAPLWVPNLAGRSSAVSVSSQDTGNALGRVRGVGGGWVGERKGAYVNTLIFRHSIVATSHITCTLLKAHTYTHTCTHTHAHTPPRAALFVDSSKLLVRIFRADLMSARPLGGPLGTGVVMLSSVLSSTGLFDAWVPLEGATQVCVSACVNVCVCTNVCVKW